MDLSEYENWLIQNGKSKSTIVTYLSRVKMFLQAVPCDPMDIDADLVEEYLQAHTHLKPQTLALTIEAVRSYARFLGLDVDITNPYRGQYEYNRRFMPSRADMRKLWRVANGLEVFYRYREKAILAVLYYAGVRIDEARTINLKDIDFINRQFSVIGKGGKSRTIPMSTPLILALLEYIEQRRQISTSTDRLFVSYGRNHRGNEIVYGSFRAIIKGLLIDAGLDLLTPYCFRHAFATNLIRRGLAPEAVAELLGHGSANGSSSLPFYIVPADVSIEDALDELDWDAPEEAA